jgi:hypothetical protein
MNTNDTNSPTAVRASRINSAVGMLCEDSVELLHVLAGTSPDRGSPLGRDAWYVADAVWKASGSVPVKVWDRLRPQEARILTFLGIHAY